MSWAGLYRLALRALPEELRLKHGRAMEALFVRELGRAHEVGRLRAALVGAGALWDVVRRGLYERWRCGRSGRTGEAALMHDLRHGLRSLRRAPAFTAVAVVILALGIGTATAMFTAFDTVVLGDLPVADPDRLVTLSLQREPSGTLFLNRAEVDALRRESRTLQDVAGIVNAGTVSMPAIEGDRPLVLDLAMVTADFFDVLGVRPVLGRLLRPEDGEEGATPVTVIGHRTWQREFGGDPGVVGRRLTITEFRESQESYEIVGVAPAGLDVPVGADYWIPSHFRDPSMDVVARLAPGVAPDAARSEFFAIAMTLDGERSSPRGPAGATVQPLHDAVIGDARPILVAATAAVGLLLLIACVNVGNLLLMRATRRSRDVVVRRALGASSGGVVRLFLVEGAALGAAGGALGLGFAVALLDLLPRLAPESVPRTEVIGLGGSPVFWAVGVTLLAIAVFGVVPAVAAARTDLASALQVDARSGTGTRGRRRLRRSLLVSQVALAVILLFGAGLLVRSLQRLGQLELGYDTDGVAIVELAIERENYGSEEETLAVLEEVYERIGSVAGVTAVTPALSRPFMGGLLQRRPVLEGQSESEAEANPRAVLELAGGEYFRTFGIPLLRGRRLLDSDRQGAPKVAVVSQALAERLWPGEDPVGRRFRMVTDDEYSWTVVGVAGDTRFQRLREPRPTIYLPWRQQTVIPSAWTVAVRTDAARADGDMASLVPTLREAVRSVDPDFYLWQVGTLKDHLAGGPLAQPRMSALLFSGFGLVALLLAAIGLHGVMALAVRERTHELGVRRALGASTARLRRDVLVDALTMTVGGALVGLLGTLLVSRLLGSLLFEVGPADPVTLAGVCGVLLIVAGAAAYLPARRATRIDPMRALRAD